MKKGRHDSYTKYKRKNLFHRATPWLIAICVAVVSAAGVYAAVRFISSRPVAESQVTYEAVADSSLPVVTMEFNGRQINELCAYTDEMDLNYAAEAIYLLEDTYDIPVCADLKGNIAKSISFYLYDIENSSLLQNGLSDDIETDGDELTATLTLASQVVSTDTEYVLDIVLELSSGQELHYYTRVLKASGTYTADQIELAYSFSEATVSGDQDAITSYMETNPWTQSNTNFSGVNLKSSISQMTWQSMDVELLSEADITILDINGTIGCYRLDYVVTVADDDITEYYRVSEYFRIRMTASASYILTYEREVDQIFIPSEANLASSYAELGILSSEDIETAASPDGAYSCFVLSGTLWLLDSSNKALIQVFSFESDDPWQDAPMYYDHDIEVMSVDDEGNIQFIVYGYMNAGLHEGLCGVGLYSYSAEDETVTEVLFIEADVPYEILKATTGEMIYINEDNELYILIDQTIYSISLDKYNIKTVKESLESGTYCVSTTQRMIAWQEDGKVNSADKITVLDAESGETYTISALAGMSIKVLGFVGDDPVYGMGTEENYYYDSADEEYLLMDTVYLKDLETGEVSEYSSSSGYFLSAEYEYNRIEIAKSDSDSLAIYSAEISAAETPEITSDYDDVKETIYYVKFVDSTTSSGNFTITMDIPVYVTDADLVAPSGFLDLSGRYLVYGKGSLQLITSSAAEAVREAYDYEGYVKTEEGFFYRRGMRASSISMSESAIEAALEAWEDGEVILITGITLTEAFYFTGEGTALVWEYEDTVWLIYGYDSGDDLLVYDVETGETSEIDDSEAEDAFDNSEGSLYVVAGS